MKYAILLVGLILLAGTGQAQTLSIREQLKTAADATGTNYFACRGKIVGAGTNAEPELDQIVHATNESWQVRLMAGVCSERIRQGPELKALLEHDWRTDPAYDKGWEKFRQGPGQEVALLMTQRCKERHLLFYCIETIWKDPSERVKGMKVHKMEWSAAVRHALQGTPEFELLVPVLAERIRKDVGFKNYETGLEFIYLSRSGTNVALPVVLELMPHANMNEDQREMEMTKVINTMVEPQDLPLIEKFYADQGGGIPQALQALKAKYNSTNNPPAQPLQKP